MSYTFEFGKDFNELKEILLSRPSQDYPYRMDNFFDRESQLGQTLDDLSNGEKFTLYAKDSNGDVVATYAARKLDFSLYANYFETRTLSLGGTYHNPTIPDGNQWYSSCQWVHIDHRGQRLGIDMDSMKKDEILKLGGDINYANCKEALKEYHISDTGLGYDLAQPQAFIPSDGVGGAGTNEDKNYFLVYEMLS